MDEETIIQSADEDWTKARPTPIADLRAFIAYAKRYGEPMDHVEIDPDNHPVHVLTPRMAVNLRSALEAQGYDVTIAVHPDEGWIVDWEKSDA